MMTIITNGGKILVIADGLPSSSSGLSAGGLDLGLTEGDGVSFCACIEEVQKVRITSANMVGVVRFATRPILRVGTGWHRAHNTSGE